VRLLLGNLKRHIEQASRKKELSPKRLNDMAQPAHFTPHKGVKNIARAIAGPVPPSGHGIARETKNVAKNQHGR